MALRERNSALHWAATRPEDNTPAVAVAVGNFVQVPVTEMRGVRKPLFAAAQGGACLRPEAERYAAISVGLSPQNRAIAAN